jgi:uncharacterized protein YbbC (DUF1343 family)
MAGRRVGLLTNHTGIDRTGLGDIERLLAADVDLTALFSPEHGFRGTLDQPNVEHALDSATGLPIFSLYGDVRAPTPDMLQRIDVLVVDLQDIGARTYTYISTALLAMRAARAAGVSIIVLDRPNPIGGLLVQGPMLDTAHASFVGMLRVPLRHGMTFGELARLGNASLNIDAELIVVPVAGWRREIWFDETGLPWVRPSPNMPDLESATHYPGLVLFEGTNLSVGRGTPIAFQVLGAPWLDPAAVRARMESTPGVTVTDSSITPVNPTDSKYPDRGLPALRFTVAEREEYDPARLAVAVLVALQDVHGDSLVFRDAVFDRLAGASTIREAVLRGDRPGEVWRDWDRAHGDFAARREAALLYE